MRNIVTIMNKELKSMFVSPIAYVVLMIFLGVTGYFFYTSLVWFTNLWQRESMIVQLTRNPERLQMLNLNYFVISRVISNMLVIFLFLLPLITMRAFAEEKKNRTEELLLTSPVSMNQLIAGKFLGLLLFTFICLAPTVLYQWLVFHYAHPELGPVVTGYMGLILFLCAGIAVGLFASSLTENQIIAAVVCFVVLLGMFIIGLVAPGESTKFGQLISYLSIQDHFENLIKGIIDTRDIIYFLTISAFFLFLTKRSMESVRWR